LPMTIFTRHQKLSTAELDNQVAQLQLEALRRKMIPIVGVISNQLGPDQHEILGFGHNELALGTPGIHGETAAVRSMGRIKPGDFKLVVTSSLSPCPFCQETLVTHLGIRNIRILDDNSYKPDKTGYQRLGIAPEICPHPQIKQTFSDWVGDPDNLPLWNRDIGIRTGPTASPHQFSALEIERLLELAVLVARQGEKDGEIPTGALIVDEHGVVIASGAPGIMRTNDPTAVAAMIAWRAAGARDDWGRCTLVLTHGPDSIAYSMFKVFGFGQLIVGSDNVYPGLLDAVRDLQLTVIVNSSRQDLIDSPLQNWLKQNSNELAKEYLGVDFAGL